MNNRIFEYLKGLRQPKVLIALGLIGILLIFVSSLVPEGRAEKAEGVQEFSAEGYRLELEKDISAMVREITGD